MILRQFLHTDPVAISYLFGCGGKTSGAVVDPVGDPKFYIEAAEKAGMRILFVIDTHIHADHTSTGRALADLAGAEYALFGGAQASIPFRGLEDGEVLELGNVTIEVLHTPGHTPGGICLLAPTDCGRRIHIHSSGGFDPGTSQNKRDKIFNSKKYYLSN